MIFAFTGCALTAMYRPSQEEAVAGMKLASATDASVAAGSQDYFA
jgi:hypothetical protein